MPPLDRMVNKVASSNHNMSSISCHRTHIYQGWVTFNKTIHIYRASYIHTCSIHSILIQQCLFSVMFPTRQYHVWYGWANTVNWSSSITPRLRRVSWLFPPNYNAHTHIKLNQVGGWHLISFRCFLFILDLYASSELSKFFAIFINADLGVHKWGWLIACDISSTCSSSIAWKH